MAAGKLDLDVEQGATFRRQLLWRQPSPDGGTTLGAPYDLTGAVAHMQVRGKAGLDPVLIELSDTDGLTLGGTAGTIDIVISSARTASLTVKKAVYDLYVIFDGGTGDAVRIVEGAVNVDQSVTLPVVEPAPAP